VEKYDLVKYDTICVVSCLSCGGCIENYIEPRNKNTNTIFVFDDDCGSPFIKKIKYARHISVQQKVLDSVFNEFGNIALLVKNKQEYNLVEKPMNWN
jgi:hypothetical protein